MVSGLLLEVAFYQWVASSSLVQNKRGKLSYDNTCKIPVSENALLISAKLQ